MKKTFMWAVTLIGLVPAGAAAQDWHMKPVVIPTRWAKQVSPTNALPEYPRPQMVRPRWTNLNGLWQYAITAKDASAPSTFAGKILVPYPLESALSGVQKWLQPEQRLWYQRTIRHPDLKAGERALLHFGAVDWQATVFVNGKEIGTHKGGYTNFSFDITDALKSGDNTLVVKVYDPSDTGPNPRGKQTLTPEGISYTPSSGIWQTVWMEVVPAVSIASLRLTPNVDSKQLEVQVNVAGDATNYTVEAIAKSKKTTAGSVKGAANKPLTVAVADPHLWSPDDPFLYDLSIRLLANGKVVDEVQSYFGMRKIEKKKDAAGYERIFLNNRYTFNLGTLDQGFWPDGLYTAPTDEALAFDIKAIKAMGFNTIRKHIKVEPARWYYHCDKLGILVWQDMVSPGDGPDARAAFEYESKEMLEQLHNYPSITTWVVFNEGWGRYDQPRLTQWAQDADSSRLINGHSGENLDWGGHHPQGDFTGMWPNSDIADMHEYPGPNPGPPPSVTGKARVVGEFGGLWGAIAGHIWTDANGYYPARVGQFTEQYVQLMDKLKLLEEKGLTGSIYTQPFDVEAEQNGLMTYDREVIKIPVSTLRQINAKLFPATANYVVATKGFSAVDADTATTRYSALLAQYKEGKRAPRFLREFALLAAQANDTVSARQAAAEYMQQLKEPYTRMDLIFITKFTQSPTDPHFDLFFKNPSKVDPILGPGAANRIVLDVVNAREIRPNIPPQVKNPDWDALEQRIGNAYGAAAGRLVWRSKMEYLFSQKEWPAYVAAATARMEKDRDQFGSDRMTAYAWRVFEGGTTDTTLLETALSWTTKALAVTETPFTLHTRANLLYRLGRSAEAIATEERVVQLDSDETFVSTLTKMKKGESTWPPQ